MASRIEKIKWSIFKNFDQQFIENIRLLYIFGTKADQYIVIANDDTIYSFGSNTNGCLGLGHNNSVQIPTKIDELSQKQVKTIEFSAAYDYILVLTNTGHIYSWGNNNYGQLGNGNTTIQNRPVAINILTDQNVIDIKCGSIMSLALTQSGVVYVWGWSIGSNPTQIGNNMQNQRIISIDCGYYHALALTDNGVVYFWGDNTYINGQYNTTSWSVVQNITNIRVTKISCGQNHCLILSDDGIVYCFGYNAYGQCGITGDRNHVKNIPTKLNITDKFTDIGAIKYYSLSVGLTDNGVCYIWGQCNGLSITIPLRVPYCNEHDIMDVLDCCSKNKTTFKPIIFGDKHNIHKNQMLLINQRISDNFNIQEFSDVSFKIEDKYIYAHKLYLTMVCNHFKTMFTKDFEEKHKKEIEEKYTYSVYYAFINYLYTNNIDLNSAKDLIGLIDLANCYLEEELKQRCVKIIKNYVTIDNVFDIYSAAVTYDLEELKEYCKNLLHNNRDDKSVTGKILDEFAKLKTAKCFDLDTNPK